MSGWRVRASRALARRFLKRDAMISALADWHRWPVRHLIDLLFFWQGPRHCERAADYESHKARRLGFVERARRQGWM